MSTRQRSYFERVQHLRTGRVGDHERPRKPAMLLAVVDLIAAGKTAGNRLAYSPELFEVFQRYHPRQDALRWRRERLLT